jgi:predicted Fe-Mo cluster-binding NifX family protein
MRLAIPAWEGRVSPVFDVAREVRIFDLNTDRREVSADHRHGLPRDGAVATLADLDVDLLVCSAISPPLEAMLWMAGIEVVADVCGELSEIVREVATGDTELARFRVPGSQGRVRQQAGGGSRPGRGSSSQTT